MNKKYAISSVRLELTIFKNQPLCLCYQRFAFVSTAYVKATEFCIKDMPYGMISAHHIV